MTRLGPVPPVPDLSAGQRPAQLHHGTDRQRLRLDLLARPGCGWVSSSNGHPWERAAGPPARMASAAAGPPGQQAIAICANRQRTALSRCSAARPRGDQALAGCLRLLRPPAAFLRVATHRTPVRASRLPHAPPVATGDASIAPSPQPRAPGATAGCATRLRLMSGRARRSRPVVAPTARPSASAVPPAPLASFPRRALPPAHEAAAQTDEVYILVR